MVLLLPDINVSCNSSCDSDFGAILKSMNNMLLYSKGVSLILYIAEISVAFIAVTKSRIAS